MKNIHEHEQGASHFIAIITVLVVAIVGVAALQVSSAYGKRSAKKTSTTSTSSTINRSSSNSGSGSTCRANGATIRAPAGQSCNITSTNGQSICSIDNRETPCQ